MNLLGLSGSPSRNAASRTLSAVKQAVEYAHAQDGVINSETIKVRDLEIELCDGIPVLNLYGHFNERTADIIFMCMDSYPNARGYVIDLRHTEIINSTWI